MPAAPPKPAASIAAHLKSNMRGYDIDLPLGKLNAIVGPTRRGKSSILESIELALTGEGPVGASHLKELAPKGDKLRVELQLFSDGDLVDACKYDAGARPVHRALGTVPEHLLPSTCPVNSFGYLLEKSAAITREEILRRFPPEGGIDLSLPAEVDEYATGIWNKLCEELAQPEQDALELILKLGGKLRSEKSQNSSRVTVETERVARLRRELAPVALRQFDIEALQVELSVAFKAEGAAAVIERSTARREELQQAVLKLRDEYCEWDLANEAWQGQGQFELLKDEYAKAEQELEAHLASPAPGAVDYTEALLEAKERVTRMRALSQVVAGAIQAELESCPCCGVNVGGFDQVHLTSLIEETQAREEALRLLEQEARDVTLRGRQQSLEWNNKKVRLERAVQQALQCVREGEEFIAHGFTLAEKCAVAEANQAAFEASFKALTRDAAEHRSTHEIRGELAEATKVLAMRKEYEEAAGALAVHVKYGEAIRTLERACMTINDRAMQAIVENVREKASVICPEGYVVEVDIDESKCGWRVLGVDGELHRSGVASGSESVTILLGAASAASADCPLRVINIDDAQLGPFRTDPAMLRSFLQRLEDAVTAGQFYMVNVAGLLPHEVPSSWNLIER